MKHLILFALFLFTSNSFATTFSVGAGRAYTVPSMVMPLVKDGDTVLIDAGNYSGDVGTWTKNNLVILCPHGYAHLEANGQSAQGKAIWVITGNNTYMQNIEFSGAAVADKNGAGIRQEGAGLRIRHCYFHDNEDGILAGDNPTSDITIEASEFARNGYGDGYSHNMYINHVRSFTLKYCNTHGAKSGHCVKSRALRSYVFYNRIMDEREGTSSYLLDLPNGGLAVIVGNTMMKGPKAENTVFVNYGEEGMTNPDTELYVVNNTMVTERSNTSFVRTAAGTKTALVINNLFIGDGVLPASVTGLSNLFKKYQNELPFADSANYDYRLTSLPAGIRPGIDPGDANGMSLIPFSEYKDPLDSARRTQNPPDIGAFEVTDGSGVEASSENLGTAVFPNPAHTDLNISGSFGSQMVEVKIYNGRGVQIRHLAIRAEARRITIPVNDLRAGTYFFELGLSHKMQSVGKFEVK